MARAEFDALVVELRELRARSQSELARRLREARNHESPGDDDDVLTVDAGPTPSHDPLAEHAA